MGEVGSIEDQCATCGSDDRRTGVPVLLRSPLMNCERGFISMLVSSAREDLLSDPSGRVRELDPEFPDPVVWESFSSMLR